MKYNEIIETLNYELNEASLNVDFVHNGLEQVFLYLNGKELEEVEEEELETRYDRRKSFYEKARIQTCRADFVGSPLEQSVEVYLLRSYGKAIAAVLQWYDLEERRWYDIAITTGTWSATSNRHEAEFFKWFINGAKGNNLTGNTTDTCSELRKYLKKYRQLITIE